MVATVRHRPSGIRQWRLLLSLLLGITIAVPAMGDELADMIAQCKTCHGANGLPSDHNIPIIQGQNYFYLYLQLKDFKAGRRANAVMSGIVQGMDKAQMKAITMYLWKQPWPRTAYKAPEGVAAEAKSAINSGQCVQCHLGGFEGSGAVPRLAGQYPTYLERTMLELKNKVRLNAPDKSSLLRTFSEEDLSALAQYLGGL
jgi:cytochrome c553